MRRYFFTKIENAVNIVMSLDFCCVLESNFMTQKVLSCVFVQEILNLQNPFYDARKQSINSLEEVRIIILIILSL